MCVPEFNIPTDRAERSRHLKKFSGEMIRCTKNNKTVSTLPKLNVMLFIADRKNSKQIKSWDGIQQFLKISGYDVEHVQITEAREADLLFICTDEDMGEAIDKDVQYLMDTIWQGFLGLALNQEVLVSTPVRHASPYTLSSKHPMIVSSDFMMYGIGMIHMYIRTVHDGGARVGRYISMMLQLEGILQQHGVIQADNDKQAYHKIEEFKSLLKCRGHADGEARWVFAVLDLLRHTRNALGHTPPPSSAVRGFEKAAEEINDLAEEYDRAFGVPPESDIQDPYGSHKKWITTLTLTALHWIDMYMEDNPV